MFSLSNHYRIKAAQKQFQTVITAVGLLAGDHQQLQHCHLLQYCSSTKLTLQTCAL